MAFWVRRVDPGIAVLEGKRSGQHPVPPGRIGPPVILRAGPPGQRRISYARLTGLVWLVILILLVTSQPGRMFYDTKLAVDINPLGFAERLWSLWNPTAWLGTLQDQYIGYSFPMLPFYLAGQLLKVPVWLTERLWLSTLIAAGFLGMMKLAAALRIGSDRSRIVAGLAFALWPTFTIVIGSVTALAIAGLLAPWAVLPLVRVVRDGSLPRAAARSGVAILFMGGVNATVTLDALLLPAMFILVQTRGWRRVKLACYWIVAVALATSWWVVPLFLQGKYSFNFLPFVEQSATTSATMSAAAFLRGAGNWTAYLNLGQPWTSAGWELIANPLAVMAAAIMAGLGLLGISRRDLPAARWLRLSLIAAALVALAGYPGPLGGPLHGAVDGWLNAGLAPLRSVYKLEPAVAAILALGVAHVLFLGHQRVTSMRDPTGLVTARLGGMLAVAVVLAGMALPYLSHNLSDPRSFTAIPNYWYQVAAFLKSHSPTAPALVVPADSHGTYLWGDSIDDPLESLATSPWVDRGLVPFGGAGAQVLLTSLEGAVESGEQVKGLVGVLARSGIKYVVVRNDLNPAMIGYTAPQVVHATLLSSGFRRVASFGPMITGRQTDPGAAPQIQRLEPTYPAVEVFAPTSANGPAPAPVAMLPVSQTILLNGGPDALLQLTGEHLLGSRPVVIAGDRLVTRPARWTITDSLRRADHTFGLISSAESYTYTPAETNPVDDPLGGAGGPPRQILPVTGAGHQTVAVLSGAANVTASSSGSWTGETEQFDPVNAFDGNPNTAWVEGNPTSAIGQWIQITFTHPVDLPSTVMIEMLDSGAAQVIADRLTVSTATGTASSKILVTSHAQPVRVPAGRSPWLRITITGARGGAPGGQGAGIRDVRIPGVRVTRYLQPAQSAAGLMAPMTSFSFQRLLPSPASLANVAQYPPMARTFTTTVLGRWKLAGAAMAIPGRALTSVLSALTPVRAKTLQVTASSTWGWLPRLAPAGLFRTRSPGSWIAGGPNPILHLKWRGDRRISRIVVTPLPTFAAAPITLSLTSPNGNRSATIGFNGNTEIVPPLRTDQMSIRFPVVQYGTTTDPLSGRSVQQPVGLAALSVPALSGLVPAQPDPATNFRLRCGHGPRLAIDGNTVETAVRGTVGDLLDFRPVQVRLCAPESALVLNPGRHWLRVAATGAFSLTDLTLSSAATSGQTASQPGGSAASAHSPARAARVLLWQADQRQVRIGPGPASYLEVHQNANPGWVATLNGHALVPVRLDGWQQAYLVPAGAGGVIDLTFTPGAFYQTWIVVSGVGVLILAVAAALGRRGRLPERSSPAVGASDAHAEQEPASGSWIGMLALCGVIAVIGGPVAVMVPVLAAMAYRWPLWLGDIALTAMVTSGVIAVIAPSPNMLGSGAFGSAAQACAVLALTAALTRVPSAPRLPTWFRRIRAAR